MQQKKQLIILAVLVIGLLVYLAFAFISKPNQNDSETLPPRLDPNSPQFRGLDPNGQ